MATSPVHDHESVLDAWLPAPPAVLADIGGGAGGLARGLAGWNYAVWLIDPQAPAHPPASGVRPLRAGAEALPLPAASLDGAVFLNALHHVPVGRMDTALAEAGRVLRPAAPLVVIEPLAEGPLYELLRPIEDEAEVRAAAQSALDRAGAAGGWNRRWQGVYRCPLRYPDAAACLEQLRAVDPARAQRIATQRETLTERFQALGRPEAGGWIFESPHRAVVLSREA